MKKGLQKTKEAKIGAYSKLKSFFLKPGVKYTLAVAALALFAFLVQYFLNRPDFGTFLSSDMDPSGNVYILGVNESQGRYKISKVLPGGSTKFQIDLEKSTDVYEYSYSSLEADSKGNFYFVKQQRDLKALVADKSLYPILSESLLMYDTNGNYVKQIAAIDFSKEANPPTSSYIKKIQLVDQNLTVIACKNNHFDIITANPLLDESPRKIKSFDIIPPVSGSTQNFEWVSDISVLSNGRVFYSTKNGEFFAMNSEGTFDNYSQVMPGSPFIIVGMGVDASDDIYFTDCVNAKFYKFSTKSSVLQNIYGLDNPLADNLKIKMNDIRTIKLISGGDYYAASKAFDKPFHVRFGNDNRVIGDLRGAIFPWGYLIMIGVILAVLAIYYAIRYIANVEIKRIPLAMRIFALFFPVFIVAMGLLVWVNTSDGVNEYITVLRSEQERGAKTVAESISGSDFTKLDHISGYMGADYVKLKDSIKEGYSDLSVKIGDRSDYLVTYIEKYGKLYTSISTCYDVNSSSYDALKYTDPDMVSSQYALADYVLEENEVKTLYDVWNKFSDKTNADQSAHVAFHDVYGKLTASFAPIKDTNGKVVGLVGNFLDEGIHGTKEFWEIFKHALAIILIITVLVGAFLCFVVKWSFRPLSKIEKAIDTMSKGEWDTRIRVDSKDELADIARAFNLMSEKIGRYTSNLIKLNKEYIRYVPKEIFKFIDKEKITQVNLHDHKITPMNLVHVSFNISCKNLFDFKDEDEVFEAVNLTYEELFKVVEKNNGIVHSFDGLSALMLFPSGWESAFNASVQFKEVNINKDIKKTMNITLGQGDVLLGVSGNENRRGVIAVSDEIMQMLSINSRLSTLGVSHVATGNIIKKAEENTPISYRYIGRAGNPVGAGYSDMYQIIDGTNKYKKDLYLSTQKTFEKGIDLYLKKEFSEARKVFTDVLRTNENDKVCVKYLMLCEEYIENAQSNSSFKKGFTGYVI